MAVGAQNRRVEQRATGGTASMVRLRRAAAFRVKLTARSAGAYITMFDIYEANSQDTWRFALGRSGTSPLAVVGINPHAATQLRADATVRRVQAIAAKAGHDGFVLLNLYPVRSRCVDVLPLRPNATAIEENRASIRRHLFATSRVWLAWGNDISKREFFASEAAFVVGLAQAAGASCECYGPLTVRGEPRHPSRASNSWAFNPIDARRYAQQVGERSAATASDL